MKQIWHMLRDLTNKVLLFRSVPVRIETGNDDEHHKPHTTDNAVDGEIAGVAVELVKLDWVEEKEQRGSSGKQTKHEVEESRQKTLHLFRRLSIDKLQPCKACTNIQKNHKLCRHTAT